MGRACHETKQRNASRSKNHSFYYIPGGGQPFSIHLDSAAESLPTRPEAAAAVSSGTGSAPYGEEAGSAQTGLPFSHILGQKEIIPK
jgi:hypothetical protein